MLLQLFAVPVGFVSFLVLPSSVQSCDLTRFSFLHFRTSFSNLSLKPLPQPVQRNPLIVFRHTNTTHEFLFLTEHRINPF